MKKILLYSLLCVFFLGVLGGCGTLQIPGGVSKTPIWVDDQRVSVVVITNNTPYKLDIRLDGGTIYEGLLPGQSWHKEFHKWFNRQYNVSLSVVAFKDGVNCGIDSRRFYINNNQSRTTGRSSKEWVIHKRDLDPP